MSGGFADLSLVGRGGQGRRGPRQLAAVVARPAVDSRRGPRRGGAPLDGGRRADRDHGDLAGTCPRRGGAALFHARGTVGCRGVAAGQDEPGEDEPSPPGGGQGHGIRGEADTRVEPPGGRFAPGLIPRPEQAGGGRFLTWRTRRRRPSTSMPTLRR